MKDSMKQFISVGLLSLGLLICFAATYKIIFLPSLTDQELIDLINQQPPVNPNQLTNTLLDESPLSDTVLIALINRTTSLPSAKLESVLLVNSPLSNKVLLALIDSDPPTNLLNNVFAVNTLTIHGVLKNNSACQGDPVLAGVDVILVDNNLDEVEGVDPAGTDVDGLFSFDPGALDVLDNEALFSLAISEDFSIQNLGFRTIEDWLRQSPVVLVLDNELKAGITVVNIDCIQDGGGVELISIINGGVGPFSFFWDFGDGNDSEDEEPFNEYEETGIFTVTLIVEDAVGCIDTAECRIEVPNCPFGIINNNALCGGEPAGGLTVSLRIFAEGEINEIVSDEILTPVVTNSSGEFVFDLDQIDDVADFVASFAPTEPQLRFEILEGGFALEDNAFQTIDNLFDNQPHVLTLSVANEEWVAHFGSLPDPSALVDTIPFRAATALDVHNNVYVTGFANSQSGLNVQDAEFVTIKYNSDGDTLWTRQFGMSTGGAGAVPLAIAVNEDCDVYVTGFQTSSFGVSEILTLKYDINGVLLEEETFDAGGNVNQGSAITLDAAGNVYVAGEVDVAGNGRDFVTIRYDEDLNEDWSATFNGPVNSFDAATSIAVSDGGGVYVTGVSVGSGTGADYATVKYNTAGVQQWVERYNGSSNQTDIAIEIALDGSEHVYVTGSSNESGEGFNVTTIKYDSDGNEEWTESFHHPGGDFDQAKAIAVSDVGNVYVTGATGTGITQLPTGVIQINTDDLDFDMLTIKYDTDGVEQWSRTSDGPFSGDLDVAHDIAIDAAGDVYITGVGQVETEVQAAFSFGFGVQSSFTITAVVVGAGSSLNITTIAPEPPVSIGSGPGDNAVTIKYNTDGDEIWQQSFDSPEGGQDGAFGIDLDQDGNVYVTGFSALFNPNNGTFGVKFTTIKYGQCTPTPDPPAPVNLTADAGPDVFIDFGDQVVLGGNPTAVGGTPPYTFAWSPPQGLALHTNDENPVADPADTRTFAVTVTDATGCIAIDDVTVNVSPRPPPTQTQHFLNEALPSNNRGFDSIPPTIMSDRFGNTFTLDELAIPQQSEFAGIFELHFFDDDNATGVGFDGNVPSGNGRRQEIIRLFQEVTDFLGYNSTAPPAQRLISQYDHSTNCPLGPQFIQVDIRESNVNMPVGVAGLGGQFYFGVPQKKVAYGAVWQYITTGFEPYWNLTGTSIGLNSTFHGSLQINFNLVDVNRQNGKADLYTVALHEVLHMLGIASRVTSNKGASLLGGYSIWDQFIISNGNPLIDLDADNCYVTTTGIPNANTNGTCGSNIQFVGPGGVPTIDVFTEPGQFTFGSQLSHVNCPDANGNFPAGFVMNPSLTTSTVQQFPHLIEAQILCALGYNVQQQFGTNAYASDPCANNDRLVAGVNDFGDFDICHAETPYMIAPPGQTSITIQENQLIANDFSATGTSCEEILIPSTGGTLAKTGGALTFTPPAGFVGKALLIYRPINASGIKGNVTYVFIDVKAPPLPPCPPEDCDLVCNGDFEALTTKDLVGTELANFTPRSLANGNSMDVFRGGESANLGACSGKVLAPDPTGGQQYVGGFASSVTGGEEAVHFSLNRPMDITKDYTLSFLAYTRCQMEVIVAGSVNPPCPLPQVAQLDVATFCTGNGLTFTPVQLAQVSPTDSWQLFTINLPAGSLGMNNLNHIVIYGAQIVSGPSTGDFFIDNVSITCDGEEPLIITSNVSNPNPCPGDKIRITYDVCLGGTAPTNINNIDLHANLPPGFTISFPSGFDTNGDVTIPAGSLSNPCTFRLTLDIDIGLGVSPGIPFPVDLLVISGGVCLASGSTNLTDLITVGVDALSIDKTVSDGAPNPGDNVTFSVKVCNDGTTTTFSNIVVQDILDPSLIFVSSMDFTLTGSTLTSNTPITLGPGQCVTLQFIAQIDPTIAPPFCVAFANCAEIISADGGACSLPISDCEPLAVTCSPCFIPGTVQIPPGPSNSGPHGAGFFNQVVEITGVFTVNTPFTISASDVRMAAGASIRVTGTTLTITNASRLFSCTDLWQGIIVDPTATVIINGGSSIEDAEVTIASNGGGIYQIDNAILNKNHIHISVSNTGAYAGTVTNSILSNAGSVTSPGTTLKNPRQGERTAVGVEVKNVGSITIGGTLFRNFFSNMDVGILALNSDLLVQNNEFRNIAAGLPPVCPLPPQICTADPGVAIFANDNNFATLNTIQVGGNQQQVNTFVDCSNSVQIANYNVVTVEKNNFTSTKTGNVNEVIGGTAVAVRNDFATTAGMQININENTINNHQFGIRYDLDNQQVLVNTNLNINRNTINNPNFFINRAIRVQGIIPLAVISLNNVWNIRENDINQSLEGIFVLNILTPPLDIVDNQITQAVGAGFRHGIRLQNSNGVQSVHRNRVDGQNTTAGTNVKGIYATLSGAVYTCNTVNNVGQSMVFEGTMPSMVEVNTMNTANDGIVLLNSAMIGPQGALGNPSGNRWMGTFTRHGARVESSDGVLSPFFVKNAPVFTPPSIGGFGPSLIPFTFTNGKARACQAGPPPDVVIGPCIEAIVADEVEYPAFEEESRWLAYQYAFEELTMDPSLITTRSVQDVYDSLTLSNMGLIQQINEALSDQDFDLALSLNGSMRPAIIIEENYKQFYDIYLSSYAIGVEATPIQMDALRSIATQCAIPGGDAVYQARVLLNWMTGRVIHYPDDCVDAANPANKKDGPSMNDTIDNTGGFEVFTHPNPANDKVQFTYNLLGEVDGALEIFDMSGRSMGRYLLDADKGSLEIDLKDYAAGVYFYQIDVAGKVFGQDKLVITR